MTVNQHRTAEPPLPGGTRGEYVRGTLTLATGTASETITLELEYDEKPAVTVSAGAGATDESVTASLVDDDPTSDGTISIRVDGATNEAKEYHVQVLDTVDAN